MPIVSENFITLLVLIKQKVAELKPLKGLEPKILTGSKQPSKRMGTNTTNRPLT
jgi:hypothetical protein